MGESVNPLQELAKEVAGRRGAVLSDARRSAAVAGYRSQYGIPETSVMDQLAQHGCFILRSDAAVCAVHDGSTLSWHGTAHCAPPPDTLRAEQTVAEWAVVAGSPLLFDDITGFPVAFSDVEALGWRSVAAMPLIFKGIAVGAILIGRTSGVPWSKREHAAIRHWMALHAIMSERRFSFASSDANRTSPELERLGSVIERVSMPMVLLNTDGEVSFANQAFCMLLGKESHEVLGRTFDRFTGCRPGDPTADYLNEMLAGKRRGFSAERLITNREGRERRVRVSATQLRYEYAGQHSCYLILEDITDNRDAERVLREREEQLHQAHERDALSQLAGGLAHDFSNTLAAITGYASLLRDDIDAHDPRREDVDHILRVVERATETTSRLMEMSLRRVAERATFDLRDVLTTFASVARRVLPTSIEWHLELPDAAVVANVDRTQIEQVLLGLVVNARDAMPQGGELRVELSVSYTEIAGSSPRRMARVSVSDSGSGIPEDLKAKLWTPFFSTKPGGTGLGLSVGLAIARDHGGDLRLESAPPRGGVFAIYLPLATPTPPAGGVRISGESRPLRSPDTGQLILFVEDEITVRVTTKRVLERAGFRVLAAEDGEEAWNLLERNFDDVDLIVTDLQMPKLSGAELIRRARQRKSDIPVVVTSAYPSADTDALDLRRGPTASLRKPFAASTLVDTVRSLISKA